MALYDYSVTTGHLKSTVIFQSRNVCSSNIVLHIQCNMTLVLKGSLYHPFFIHTFFIILLQVDDTAALICFDLEFEHVRWLVLNLSLLQYNISLIAVSEIMFACPIAKMTD